MRKWRVIDAKGREHLISAGTLVQRKDTAMFMQREPRSGFDLVIGSPDDDVIAMFTSPISVIQEPDE